MDDSCAPHERRSSSGQGVAGGTTPPREASELVGQPECLRREFSVGESDALVCVCKPWDLRLRLDKAPQWEGEIGLDAWLADEHPATCTPEGTAWLCHNLDFATSGIIVAAKSSAAAGEVSRCFREREADKLYAALVFGHPEWDERKIKAPIAVSQRRFKQRVAASGKSAETHAFVGARGTLRIQPQLAATRAALARPEDRAAPPAPPPPEPRRPPDRRRRDVRVGQAVLPHVFARHRAETAAAAAV